MTMTMYFLNVEIFYPPGQQKNQYIHGTLLYISSCKRFTSADAKAGSSLLNYLTSKCSTNCRLFQFSNDSDDAFIITDITGFYVFKTVIPKYYAMTNCNL